MSKIQKIKLESELKPSNSSGDICFTWDIHYKCNFRCPYCWFYTDWTEVARRNIYLSSEELMKHWMRVYNKYGQVHIEITSGEPFIYPNFTKLIKELSSIHSIVITTNLSTDIEYFITQIDSFKVKVSPTFHPLFAEFDSFIKKALLLKENGFTDNISYLAYPPQIKQIPYYKERFNQKGLSLSVMTFWGEYKGINYPHGYTEEEKEIIRGHLGKRAGEEFQLVPKRMPKGRLCRAGQRYAVIQADGNIIRCGGSGLTEIIGNFFDDNFRLLEKPMPCKAEYCKCNEWAFLLMEETVPERPPKSPRLALPYRIFWNWDITYECNYRCSYCNIIHGRFPCRPGQEKGPYVILNEWKEIWDRIFEKYYTGVIRLSGGEPSIYPNFIDLVAMLSEKYVVEITTNLSFDINSFLNKTEPDNICIAASLHPEFIEFEKFLDRLLLLYNRGYHVSICFVAYPPHLEQMEMFKETAEQKGIFFNVSPLLGKFEGRIYPQSYTDTERKYLERITSNSSLNTEINTQWYQYKINKEENTDTRGKLCRMGQMYAKILPNGDVTRCCMTTSGDLGNIFDEDFELLDRSQPCEVDTMCPCFKAMLVNEEVSRLPLWSFPEHKIYRTDYIKQLVSEKELVK